MLYRPFLQIKYWVLYCLALTAFFGFFIHKRLIGYADVPSSLVWLRTMEMPDFFFPLWVGLPIALFVYSIKKYNYIDYLELREKNRSVLRKALVTAMILGFVCVFVFYFTSFIAFSFLGDAGSEEISNTYQTYLFSNFFIDHPLFFTLIYSLFKAFIALSCILLSFIFAYYLNNMVLISLMPLILHFAIVMIPQHLNTNLYHYNLQIALNIYLFDPVAQKLGYIIGSAILAFAVAPLTWLVFHLIEKMKLKELQ